VTTWPADMEERRRGVGCPACADGRPGAIPDGERIFAGATSDAYLSRSSAARGYTLLSWRGRHVGNSMPHLHAHIIPRYWGDPNPGRPPRFMMEEGEWPVIGEDDYQFQLRALRDLLGQDTTHP
jgi:hypothetical protein